MLTALARVVKINLTKFLIIILSLQLGCTEREKEYYKNGSLKSEVSLSNGVRHGKKIDYFENGNIQSVSHWRNGLLNGEVIYYYENGNVESKGEFFNDIRCCVTEFYAEDGKLIQKLFYDSIGRLYDFILFDKKGKQVDAPRSRKPIILSVSDTIEFKENYKAVIRLANRKYQLIEAYLSVEKMPDLLKEEKLPKLDSVTPLLTISNHIEGWNEVNGTIIEINTNFHDSILVIPFKTKYFVVKKND